MRKGRYITTSLLFLIILFPHLAFSEEIKKIQDKIKRIQTLVHEITAETTNNTPNAVRGVDKQNLDNDPNISDYLLNQLIANLNTLASLSANVKNLVVPKLQWASVINMKLPSLALTNVGSSTQTLNLCRAAFIGANVTQRAMYPGELTKNGCRISYAGYAFTVPTFDVLSGNNPDLAWFSVTSIKKLVKEMPEKQYGINDQVFSPQSGTYNLYKKVGNALPISGGFEGGHHVLICRTKQQGQYVLGKLIFFNNSAGEWRDACDIGVQDKEVTIQDTYELLYWNQKV